jgi:hypothetical protein
MAVRSVRAKNWREKMKFLNSIFSRPFAHLLVIFGSLQLSGCCPYSQGLVTDMSAQTQSSAANALGYTEGYLESLGYRIWQKDDLNGYIRGSVKRDSTSLGYRVEDVLAVSIKEESGGARCEVTAETYKLGSRRVKVKVSKEARSDASGLKDGLSRYNPNTGEK